MTWEWLTLNDILVPQSTKKPLQQGWSPRCRPEPADSGEWGVLKTTAIQPGHFDPAHNKALPASLDPRPHIEVKAGDLLITCAGPRSRCGVPALVRHAPPRLMMSGKMYRFRPDARMMPRFLELWLLSAEAQRQIDSMKTGISESGLNLTHGRFVRLPVPVPPIPEQRRIVDTLESHLSRLDAAETVLASVKLRIEALRRRRPDPVTEISGPLVRLESLLSEPLRNGYSGRATSSSTGVRTLTLSAVTHGEFHNLYTKVSEVPDKKASGLWLESGDIFVQRSNTPDLVGSSALYRGPENWAIFPDLLIRVRVDEERMLPEFLLEVLQSETVRSQFRSAARGLAGSMPKISQQTISNVMVPAPSIDDQRAWVASSTNADEERGRLSAAIEVSKRRSAILRQALLRTAFAGELVDHDHADEPIAEVLAGSR